MYSGVRKYSGGLACDSKVADALLGPAREPVAAQFGSPEFTESSISGIVYALIPSLLLTRQTSSRFLMLTKSVGFNVFHCAAIDVISILPALSRLDHSCLL